MKNWTDWIQAICAIVNVIVVVALAIFNYKYLRAAERSAKAAEEQAQAARDSLAAVHRTVRLDSEREQELMRGALSATLAFLRGTEESLTKSRRVPMPVMPKAWTDGRPLLRARRPLSLPQIEQFEFTFEMMRSAYKDYAALLDRGGIGHGVRSELHKQTHAAAEMVAEMLDSI